MKHIPIPNKNELDDSKLSGIIVKWAAPAVSESSDNLTTPSKSQSDESPSDNETKNEDDNGGNTSQDESSKEDENESSKKNSKSSEEGISGFE